MSLRNMMTMMGLGSAKKDSLISDSDRQKNAAEIKAEIEAKKAAETQARAIQQSLVNDTMLNKHTAIVNDFENLKQELKAIDELRIDTPNSPNQLFQTYLANANGYNKNIKDYLDKTPIAILKTQHAALKSAYNAFMSLGQLDHYNTFSNQANQAKTVISTYRPK